ncbi:MAG: ParB/RepB/Spo0J family partition protein [Christensenellaceae bacterium]|nr:ParB/RepB/Spo0J family partition protein [Christensenellaceae bacterium]
MSKRIALGRGIDALFEEYSQAREEENPAAEAVVRIGINQIDPNRDQPRKAFDAAKLESLAQSIRSVGILQPIVVARREDRYQIIAGERRWRASRLAGLTELPCIVRDADTIARMEMSLIENIQRADLNPLEEALAVQALIQQCAITQEEAAERLGKSRPAVANLLRLLGLPKALQEMLAEGKLSEGHARALAAVENEEEQYALALAVIQEEMSVRQLEAALKRRREQGAKGRKKAPRSLAELGLLEEAARRLFGVKVTAQGSARRGKLILHYASAEELERIYKAIELEQ